VAANLLGDAAGDDDLLGGAGSSGGPGDAAGGSGAAAPQRGGSGGALLDLGGLLGDWGSPAAAAAPPQAQQRPPPEPPLALSPHARLSPAEFQGRWRALQPAFTSVSPLGAAAVAALPADGHRAFCAHMSRAHLHTMASGGAPPAYRYYFYGVLAAPPPPGGPPPAFYVELAVATDARTASVAVKAEPSVSRLVPQFVELWSSCLAGWER